MRGWSNGGSPVSYAGFCAFESHPRNQSMIKQKGKPRGRPFPKGVSPNPSGRPKSRLIQFLDEALSETDPKTKKTKEKMIAERIVADAVDGDQEARSMIFNRMLGKVPDEVNLKGSESLFPNLTDEELMKRYAAAVVGVRPGKPQSGA